MFRRVMRHGFSYLEVVRNGKHDETEETFDRDIFNSKLKLRAMFGTRVSLESIFRVYLN